ncbi:NEDD8-activating enzyme E1 regulatory subunit [Hyphodiscus hymeniophilus]|uniref:NEDD8-activating enzyme E1 regulatory subunit n=1 Tax=Hyphodiscus hymeniophilus TaxID=353542 RepID=A0A9P6VQJ7_9HELO|nr:NEDD8-activating enzyme E1 regulatory subunit [Hyphodiscus hymeniophilus]
MDQTPPILHGPSDKEKKYDRQLRLWAAEGQQALEDAHILLVNSGCGTVGVETLKNLVLPGIGHFTIADSATVNEADLGVNFFLDEDCLGKSRAECCVKLLLELNPDNDDIRKLLGSEKQYTLVIYSLPIDPADLALVKKYGEEHKVPLLSVHSAGFYSYFRLHLPGNFPIVDTHPESTSTTDLRLLKPWPELSKFADDLTNDIENLSAHEHGHVPYIALLLHYLRKWKESHGEYPSTYKDKKAFAAFVAAGARTDSPEGGEENYDEAVAAVLKTISTPTLPGALEEVFDYKPDEIEAGTTFWIIADAVKQFYMKHNELPLPGSVPDMKAQSTVYVKLQNLYKAKARQDVAEVDEMVRTHSKGREIDAVEVETFCKNAAFIKLIRASSTPMDLQKLSNSEFENEQFALSPSLLPIYLALDATSHTPYASSSDIIATIDKTIPEASSNTRIVQAAEEVARAKGGELQNISALTGGMVSQEVIKIITKQYIPINNTCIFDGIASRTQVLCL